MAITTLPNAPEQHMQCSIYYDKIEIYTTTLAKLLERDNIDSTLPKRQEALRGSMPESCVTTTADEIYLTKHQSLGEYLRNNHFTAEDFGDTTKEANRTTKNILRTFREREGGVFI
jgi:hypothetical protein